MKDEYAKECEEPQRVQLRLVKTLGAGRRRCG